MKRPKRIRVIANDPTCHIDISPLIGGDYEVVLFDFESDYIQIQSNCFGRINLTPNEYEVLEMSEEKTIKFGPKWNEHTQEFEVSFDSELFAIQRPFSSKIMSLKRGEAEALRDALNEFLNTEPEPSEQSGALNSDDDYESFKVFFSGILKPENSTLIGSTTSPIGELYEVPASVFFELFRKELNAGHTLSTEHVFVNGVNHRAFFYPNGPWGD